MLRLLIVRSKENGLHILTFDSELCTKPYPHSSESIIASEDLQAIISTLQNYLYSEASHAIVSIA